MGIFDKIGGFFEDVFGFIGDAISWLLGLPDEDDYQGQLINKQSNVANIPVVYGKRLVGGTRVFVSTGGSRKNEYMYLVLALAEGEVNSIDKVYVNDKLMVGSAVSGKPYKKVTTGDYKNIIWYQTFTGTDSQTACTTLFNDIGSGGPDDTWGTNHRLRGVAYIAMVIKYNQDKGMTAIPEIRCEVKGKKVFDPRTDTTAWSDNPALCLRDYLTNSRYGKGLPTSAIDDDAFEAAADFCDETVSSYTGGPNINTFNLNMILDTGNTIFDNTKRFLVAMRGIMPYSQGKYSLLIDKDESSVGTIDDTIYTKDISIKSVTKNTKLNQVKVKFVNPYKRYEQDSVIWPIAGSSDETTFLSEDNNQVLSKEITLDTVTNFYQARELARVAVLASRKSSIVCELICNSEALKYAVGDVVTLDQPSMGWTGASTKDFRILSMQLSNSGEVGLTLQEYDSSIYPWVVDSQQDDQPETTLPNPNSVDAITTASITTDAQVLNDGTIQYYADLTWTAPDDELIEDYVIKINKKVGSTTTNDIETITTINNQARYIITDTNAEYGYTIQARNGAQVKSDEFTISPVAVSVDTTAPANPTLPDSDVLVGGNRQIALDWINPTDEDFDVVQIQVSTTSTQPADTEILATVKTSYYIHEVNEHNATRYYWIRALDRSGNASGWVALGNATTATKLGSADLDTSVDDRIDQRIDAYGLGSAGDFDSQVAKFSKFAANEFTLDAVFDDFDHGNQDVTITITGSKTWSLYTTTDPRPNNEANNNFTLTLYRKKSADTTWTQVTQWTRDGASGIVGGNYVLGGTNTYYNGITVDLSYTDDSSNLDNNVDYDYKLEPSNIGSNYRFDVVLTVEVNEIGTNNLADNYVDSFSINDTTGLITLGRTNGLSDLTDSIAPYVSSQVSNLVDSAPDTLNTLNELASALGDDANFSVTVTNSIATKASKSGDTFTGDVHIDDADLIVSRGTNSYRQSDHIAYFGGDGLASADASIYIGNRGDGTGYGWELFYQGTGSGNNNKFIIRAENLGTEVDALAFTQDGNATFAGKVGINSTNPSAKLAIQTDGDEGIRLYRTGTNANFGGIEFRNSDDTATNGRIGWNADQLRLEATDEMLFVTSASEAMRLASGGQLLVNTTNTGGMSKGTIIAGDASSVGGGVGLALRYGSSDTLNVFGSMYSSSAALLGYGVRSSTSNANTFLSTADNSNFARGALTVDNTLVFKNSGAQTTTVGNEVTMTERFKVDASGNLTASGGISASGRLTITDDTAGDGSWQSGILIKNTNSTAGEPAIAFQNTAMGSNYWIVGSNQDNELHFSYGTGFTDSNAKMVLKSDGKLGVSAGAGTLTEKLTVHGAITSTYQAANFSTGSYRASMDIVDSSKIVRIGSIKGTNTPTGDQGEVQLLVNNSVKAKLKTNGDFDLISGGYKINGTNVIDSSRYITGVRLYVGSGGGFFYNDSGSRVRINQDFYTNNANTYLYGDNVYLGASSGDSIHCRSNPVDGNGWSIPNGGFATFFKLNVDRGRNHLVNSNGTDGDGLYHYSIDNNYYGANPSYTYNNVLHFGSDNSRWAEIAIPYGGNDSLFYRRRSDNGQLGAWQTVPSYGRNSNLGVLHATDFAISGTTIIDSNRNASFAKLTLTSSNDTIVTNHPAMRRGSSGEAYIDAPSHIIMNIDTNNNNTDRYFAVRKNASTSNVFQVNENGSATLTGPSIGTSSGDVSTHLELLGSRHDIIFKQIRTASGNDWNNTTFRIQARVDATNHQAIDFTTDGSYNEHIDFYTGNLLHHSRFNRDGTLELKRGGITISGNGNELNFTGGNNRIKFSGNRAMEGTTDGVNLHLAEQYTHVNCLANMNLSSGHAYRINGTTVISSAREIQNASIAPYIGLKDNSYTSPSLYAYGLGETLHAHATPLQDSLQGNVLAFKHPRIYGKSGSTWTDLGVNKNLTDGKMAHRWNPFTLSRSYSEFIIYFGNDLGYSFLNAVTMMHSTNGNSMRLIIETHETAGATATGWTTRFDTVSNVGSWPGSTVMRKTIGVGGGYDNLFRIRIIPNWSHASNSIQIGQITATAGYGSFSRLFNWDGDKNVGFYSEVTLPSTIKATDSNLKLWAGGNHILNMDLNGKIYPQSDDTCDLGFSSSTNRFRNLHLTESVTVNGTAIVDSSRNIYGETITGYKVRTDRYTIASPRYDTSFYVLQSQHWYSHASSDVMYLGESGNKTRVRGSMRVGSNASPDSGYKFQVDGSVKVSSNILANGNVTAYSDITLKDNINEIDNALEKVNSIRGVTYDRIDQDNARHAGVIAQEVEEVLPEVVHTDGNGIKSVAYGNMVGLLIEAIKEQQAQINELKEELKNGNN